ncbi:hypothetical protein Taro_021537 [Colocasia esculenta]|uniref:UBN2 domain-containing protein n=1 Tax=Colocasia esculenta TaxID=4460 RepID=A0A843V1I5_COLES|nr:hypothetical protein [Colocasia esculenta]
MRRMGSALGLPYFNSAKDLTSTTLDVEFNLKRQHRWTLTLSQWLALAVNPKSTTMEFSRVFACKSAKEMWDKLQITYEGTDKVKQTRIDILVSQYKQFEMLPNENITQMLITI